MDPLTHILVTRKFISKDIGIIGLGLAPDLPFYLTYPGWLVARREAGQALRTGNWPDPPKRMGSAHHAFHSLPIVFSFAVLIRLLNGRWPRRALYAWTLHILVDIPTHSCRRWGPKFLWPFSNYAFDGFSWAEVLHTWLKSTNKHSGNSD